MAASERNILKGLIDMNKKQYLLPGVFFYVVAFLIVIFNTSIFIDPSKSDLLIVSVGGLVGLSVANLNEYRLIKKKEIEGGY